MTQRAASKPTATTPGHRSRANGDEAPFPPAPRGDIRSGRPYLLSLTSFRAIARRAASVATLVSLDICGLALGLYVALGLREIWAGQTAPLWGLLWDAEMSWLPFVTLVTVLVFWHWGLYAPRERRAAAGFGRIISALALVALLAVAFAVGSGLDFRTYAFAPTAVVVAAVFIGVFRASYEEVTRAILRLTGVRRRALLVGEGDELEQLRRSLGASRSGVEYEFVGALAPSPHGKLPFLGSPRDLPHALATRAVDEVIIAHSNLREEDLLEVVEHAHRRGIQVLVAPKTTEILTSRAQYVAGQGVPLFELRPPVFAGSDWALKRAFDVLVSVALIVGGLPLWLLIALAIRVTSTGPIFYLDRRTGLNERPFLMFKFRTMYADAAERQAQLEQANEAGGILFKIRDDPRRTPVGAILRRFSLDEIPQLLNVLRGEMTLVGPRPLPMRDYERLEPWHRKRYLVLPGMTGLWQISGRSELSFDDLVRLDFYYLENWSLWLDISILVKTIPAVFARRGAY